ncbi:LysE family transporter [Actinoplanes sp. NPDC051494]|uniref:LysE family transporter n=1 Tax=Actinoplanes sp. NPDC051494 TaxID=3363907 RepID=UPI00378F6992
MIADFLAGAIAGYGVAVPVGAIGVLIAGLSARVCFRTGAAAGLGAATADGVYAALAIIGGTALAEAIAPLATALRWAAAAVLLTLAGWTAVNRTTPAEGTDGSSPTRAYLGVLGLTLLNPVTVVYFAALVLGRGGDGGGAWFVVGAFLASTSWQLLIAASGSLAGRFLTGPRARTVTTLVSSAVIAALAVLMVL